jgi:hypothetical protein
VPDRHRSGDVDPGVDGDIRDVEGQFRRLATPWASGMAGQGRAKRLFAQTEQAGVALADAEIDQRRGRRIRPGGREQRQCAVQWRLRQPNLPGVKHLGRAQRVHRQAAGSVKVGSLGSLTS